MLVGIAACASLLVSGIQTGHTQQRFSDQQIKAAMQGINFLLMSDECTDTDGDTLCDSSEIAFFGSLNENQNGDFDADNISNGDELNIYESNPNSTNSDADALGDYAELLLGTSLSVAFSKGGTLGNDTPQDRAMLHQLNRLTFGPTQVEINQVAVAGGITNWITNQLIPIAIPPAPPRQNSGSSVAPIYDGDTFPRPYDCSAHSPPDPAQQKRDCYISENDNNADIVATFRPVHSNRQLQTRMAMFWDNHFNTDLNSHGKGMQELHDEDNWFANAFGNFRDLLSLNTKNYTMLEYLSLDDNRKFSPNENFPRELMELHSVSINGGYTATDIAQLAYILTGWDHEDVRNISGICGDTTNINTCTPYISRYPYRARADNDNEGSGETGLDESAKFNPLRIFEFNIDDHDDGAFDYDNDGMINLTKTLYSGTVNQITIASQGGANGVLEGEQALDFFATHPSTAKFICKKLAQEFISDTPQPVTLGNCETVFLANSSSPAQIKLVLSSLLNSAEFVAPTTYRNKLKDSQEIILSLSRLLGWDAAEGSQTSYCPSRSKNIASIISCAEQRIFYKSEPTGYYETSDNWLDPNIVFQRFRELNTMVFFDDQTRSFVNYFNGLGLTASGEIMAHLFLLMLGGNYDEQDVQLGFNILHKVDPDNLGSSAIQPFNLNDQTDNFRYYLGGNGNGIPDSEDRIRALIARLAALPEFHLH